LSSDVCDVPVADSGDWPPGPINRRDIGHDRSPSTGCAGEVACGDESLAGPISSSVIPSSAPSARGDPLAASRVAVSRVARRREGRDIGLVQRFRFMDPS
jgi:hypothetical protein